MKKSTLLKLLSLAICAMMLLSMLTACPAANTEETKAPESDPIVTPPESGDDTDDTDDTDETEPGDDTDETEPGDDTDETDPGDGTDESTDGTDTPPAPACDGDHTPEYDAEGHWRDACDEHGVPAVAKTAHSYRTNDDGTYSCGVCGYEPDCGGEHWVADAAGHSMPACEDCGFAGDPEAAGEHDYDEDLVCTICDYAPECYGEHEYEANGAEGHVVKACEYCGAAAGELEPHTAVEDAVEAGGETVYTYTCSVCEYEVAKITVSANINSYLTGSALCVGGAYKASSSVVDYFYRLTSKDVTMEQSWICEPYHLTDAGTLGTGNPPTAAGDANIEKIDAGKAQFMVIKLRADKVKSFDVQLGTTAFTHEDQTAGNRGGILNGMSIVPTSDWSVFVFDLSLFGTKAAADADGNRIIDTLRFSTTGGTEVGGYIDVAYIAFVDGWTEVDELVGDDEKDTVVQVTGSKTTKLVNPDGTPHTVVPVETVETTETQVKYVVTCSCCNRVAQTVTVPASVNAYITPYELFRMSFSDWKCTDAIIDGVYHLAGTAENAGAQQQWLRDPLDHSAGGTKEDVSHINVGTAKWMVIKAKASNLAQRFSVGISTTGKNSTHPQSNRDGFAIFTPKFTEVDTWTTFVIDLSAVMSNVYVAVDGSYVIDSFYLDFGNMPLESTFDIEYFAFVDDWKEIEAVAGKTTVQNVIAKDGTAVEINSDGTCVEHTFTTLANKCDVCAAVTEHTCADANADNACDLCAGHVHSYNTLAKKCDACGEIADHECADADLNEVCDLCGEAVDNGDGQVNATLTGADLAVSGAYQATATNVEGVFHFVMPGKNASQHLWMREGYYKDAAAAAAAAGTPPTGTNNIPNVELGKAQYMIVKIKTNAANNIGFFMGTTAYTYVDAGTKYGQSNIYSAVNVKPGATEEWTTYIIPLSLFGEKAKADADGNRAIDTFMLNYGASNADEYIDIEYIAFVDSMAEVSLVTGAATVNKVVNASGTVESVQIPAA